MIDRKMLGLMVAVLGIGLVVSGTIMFVVESSEPSNDAFCGFCLTKRPIYCLKTFHGMLFDAGWLLTIVGSIIMFSYGKRKLAFFNLGI
jgi:hypothetical protein